MVVDFTFYSNFTAWHVGFANFDTLDVTNPNLSRAFGARAAVLGYVDGGARQK